MESRSLFEALHKIVRIRLATEGTLLNQGSRTSTGPKMTHVPPGLLCPACSGTVSSGRANSVLYRYQCHQGGQHSRTMQIDSLGHRLTCQLCEG